MPASYPAVLPVKVAAGANLSTNPHSTLHDGMYDEIVALATELGTDVAGTFATLKARLADAYLTPSVFTRLAAQSIPSSAYTPVSFTSESSDPEGWGTVPTSTFTCPAGGWYTIVSYLVYSNTAATGTSTSRIQIGGEVQVGSSLFIMTTTGAIRLRGSFSCYLEPAQTVELAAYHTTGAATDITARLMIKRTA